MKHLKHLCKLIYRGVTCDFDHRSRLQLIPLVLVLLCCLVIAASPISEAAPDWPYPMTQAELERNNIFVRQFDALMKGQTHLELPVSGRLEALDNPYDPEARDENYASFYWDHAFFEGRYYSYFGLAPVLTVYFPYYFATGCVPETVKVCAFLAMAALVAMTAALRELVIFSGGRPKLLLLLAAVPTLAFGCGIFPGQSYSDFYYIPVLSSILFVFAFLALVLRGVRAEKTLPSALLLAAGALAFVLAVMSRPTAALACLCLTPLLIKKLFLGKDPLKTRLALTLPFGGVMALGAAAVMTFNYARFGSILDFGANYQLTVSDISKNTLDLAQLPKAIFQYFLQPPEPRAEYPYVAPSYIVMDYGERYVYVDRTVGALFFPVTWGLFAAPLLFSIRDRIKRAEGRDLTRLAVFATGALIPVALAFFDFCKAGVNMRYLFDLLPLSAILGAALLLRYSSDSKDGSLVLRRTAAVALLFALTMAVGYGIIAANDYSVILKKS